MAKQFPTILYKLGGPNRGPKGKTYSYIGVDNKEEYDEAIRNDWLSDLGKACEGEDKKPVKKRFSNAATGEGIETKSGEKLILGKAGVVKRKDDYGNRKHSNKKEEEVEIKGESEE
jgi:hypothetical protein